MNISESMRKVIDNSSHKQMDKFSKELNLDSNTTLDILMPIAPVIGQAADTISTIMALNRGYEEANPFLRNVVRRVPVFIAVKAGIGAIAALGVHKLNKDGHKTTAKIVSGLGFLLGAGPAISNTLLIRRK